jgi:hypothetical protein
MSELIKLLIFFIVLSSMALLGYWFYKKLNQRILASETAGSLIFYSLMLIVSNFILLFGGIFLLIKTFELLSSSGT